MTYLLITTPQNENFLVAEQLATSLLSKLSLTLEDLKSVRIPGSDLLNCKYQNPLISSSPVYPILPAGYVTADSGTGLVHSPLSTEKENLPMLFFLYLFRDCRSLKREIKLSWTFSRILVPLYISIYMNTDTLTIGDQRNLLLYEQRNNGSRT
jgi:hypothetical protein